MFDSFSFRLLFLMTVFFLKIIKLNKVYLEKTHGYPSCVGSLPVINSDLNEGFTSKMPPVTQTFHVILADHEPVYMF